MPHRFLPSTATGCCSARAHSVTRQRVPNADVRPSSQSARTKKNRNPTVWSCRPPARPTTSAGTKPLIFQCIFLRLIGFNQQMTGCKFIGGKVQNESGKHIPAPKNGISCLMGANLTTPVEMNSLRPKSLTQMKNSVRDT